MSNLNTHVLYKLYYDNRPHVVEQTWDKSEKLEMHCGRENRALTVPKRGDHHKVRNKVVVNAHSSTLLSIALEGS
jgi:hypothetical protein